MVCNFSEGQRRGAGGQSIQQLIKTLTNGAWKAKITNATSVARLKRSLCYVVGRPRGNDGDGTGTFWFLRKLPHQENAAKTFKSCCSGNRFSVWQILPQREENTDKQHQQICCSDGVSVKQLVGRQQKYSSRLRFGGFASCVYGLMYLIWIFYHTFYHQLLHTVRFKHVPWVLLGPLTLHKMLCTRPFYWFSAASEDRWGFGAGGGCWQLNDLWLVMILSHSWATDINQWPSTETAARVTIRAFISLFSPHWTHSAPVNLS